MDININLIDGQTLQIVAFFVSVATFGCVAVTATTVYEIAKILYGAKDA